VLAPRARWRPDLVAYRRTERDRATDRRAEGAGALRSRYRTWALLMRRGFDLDVLRCPRCAGRMQLIATIDDPGVIQKILAHPVIQGPDLTSDPRSGRIGATWEWVYPRCDTADPGGTPSDEAGHD
jgi:hypothetical protein